MLDNINKLYKTVDKCDDEKRFKSNIEEAMVSTPEGLTGNSTMAVATSHTTNKILRQFSDLFDVKYKMAVFGLSVYNMKHKTISKCTSLW